MAASCSNSRLEIAPQAGNDYVSARTQWWVVPEAGTHPRKRAPQARSARPRACERAPRRVGYERPQAVQGKSGGRLLGMSGIFLFTQHLKNESQDADSVVIFRQLCLRNPRCSRHGYNFLAVLRMHGAFAICSGSLPRHCPPKNGPHWTCTSLSTPLRLARDCAQTL